MNTSLESTAPRVRAWSVIRWAAARLPGVAIGMAGLAKFYAAARWDRLFASWGYPAGFSKVIGVVEVVGAVLLFVPRTTLYGAAILVATMVGALVTLLAHRGGQFGWGSTPLVYSVWLTAVAILRWKSTRVSRRRCARPFASSANGHERLRTLPFRILASGRSVYDRS